MNRLPWLVDLRILDVVDDDWLIGVACWRWLLIGAACLVLRDTATVVVAHTTTTTPTTTHTTITAIATTTTSKNNNNNYYYYYDYYS